MKKKVPFALPDRSSHPMTKKINKSNRNKERDANMKLFLSLRIDSENQSSRGEVISVF
jgi:hypothetical protein